MMDLYDWELEELETDLDDCCEGVCDDCMDPDEWALWDSRLRFLNS